MECLSILWQLLHLYSVVATAIFMYTIGGDISDAYLHVLLCGGSYLGTLDFVKHCLTRANQDGELSTQRKNNNQRTLLFSVLSVTYKCSFPCVSILTLVCFFLLLGSDRMTNYQASLLAGIWIYAILSFSVVFVWILKLYLDFRDGRLEIADFFKFLKQSYLARRRNARLDSVMSDPSQIYDHMIEEYSKHQFSGYAPSNFERAELNFLTLYCSVQAVKAYKPNKTIWSTCKRCKSAEPDPSVVFPNCGHSIHPDCLEYEIKACHIWQCCGVSYRIQIRNLCEFQQAQKKPFLPGDM